MSKIGHAARAAAEVVRFRKRAADAPGVETLSLAQLRRRAGTVHLASVQRLEFLLLVLYTRGRGEHMVDFVSHRVGPDTLIVVRPGSVQRFGLNASMDARLVAVDPVFISPNRSVLMPSHHAVDVWPVRTILPPAARDEFLALCDQIDADLRRTAPPPLRASLTRYRAHTLLLLLQIEWARGAERDAAKVAARPPLLAAFRNLLEQHHTQRWTVRDYARELGCAERTLTRTCQAAVARSAKALIDERVLLEAKRLLAHGDDSIESVALDLGFGGASPFVQFFRRLEGITPGAFRRRLRRSDAAACD